MRNNEIHEGPLVEIGLENTVVLDDELLKFLYGWFGLAIYLS